MYLIQVCLHQNEQITAAAVQAVGAHFQLPAGFFTAYIQDLLPGGKAAAKLKEQRGFADTWGAAYQHQ